MGGSVAHRGKEWIRITGPGGAVRLFPGPDRVDLQLVGANEGALVGLRFRYGIALTSEPPPGGPVGVHHRVRDVGEVSGALVELLKEWLSGEVPSSGSGPPVAAPDADPTAR